MSHRYVAVDQLHWLDTCDGRTVVVTLQRWQSAGESNGIGLKRLHDGQVVSRQHITNRHAVAAALNKFTERRRPPLRTLTEDEALDAIAEHTGTRPEQTFCLRTGCGFAVPLAADRCADGHSVAQVVNGYGSAMRHIPQMRTTVETVETTS
jgi:hypothetical protein